jgi:H+-transporting ATPase
MMYLMLSVAGHLTIFQARTRGPWWSNRPAWILLGAVCGTQIVATLVAVYGAGLVAPLGWRYAGLVWAYGFACFLITDPVKLIAYKVLDSTWVGSRPAGAGHFVAQAIDEAESSRAVAAPPVDKDAVRPPPVPKAAE